jgi:hypothetical protein
MTTPRREARDATDGKKQRLELVLGSFIEKLQKWIAHEREHRLERGNRGATTN